MGNQRPLFIVFIFGFIKQTLQFLQKYLKNVHPVSRVGIRTHDILEFPVTTSHGLPLTIKYLQLFCFRPKTYTLIFYFSMRNSHPIHLRFNLSLNLSLRQSIS